MGSAQATTRSYTVRILLNQTCGPGHLLRGAHQVDREYRVMAALQGTGVPVPRTLLFCDDPSILGTLFYVMQFVNGRVLEEIATLAPQGA